MGLFYHYRGGSINHYGWQTAIKIYRYIFFFLFVYGNNFLFVFFVYTAYCYHWPPTPVWHQANVTNTHMRKGGTLLVAIH